MNKTIGIFGDSWSCGVWDVVDTEYRVIHLGINHYLFADNFYTTNFSYPGSSNNNNLNLLKKYHSNFDIKIFVVTEPFRDFYNDPATYDATKKFQQNCKSLVDDQLEQIENLCGDSCVLVGGLHKIKTDRKKILHCINWVELIASDVDWPVYFADPGQLGEKLRNNDLDVPDLVDTTSDQESYESFFQLMQNKEKYFKPDGRHPNILGHKILYKAINDVL